MGLNMDINKINCDFKKLSFHSQTSRVLIYHKD